MKASTKQYARGLYEATIDASKNELPEIISRFIETLNANNSLSKADDILEEYVSIWNEAEGIVAAEVVTAQKLDKETAETIEEYAKEMTGAKKIELEQRISPEVIAGFILRAGDQVFDASAATKLKRLKREIAG